MIQYKLEHVVSVAHWDIAPQENSELWREYIKKATEDLAKFLIENNAIQIKISPMMDQPKWTIIVSTSAAQKPRILP